MELNVHLTPTDGEPLKNPTRYRHIISSLDYLDATRTNISYFVCILSQFDSASHSYPLVTFSVSRVIFVGPSLIACSFHALSLYSFRHIVMLSGSVIPLIVILFLPTVFFLVILSSLERLRSR
jgi:hypothetical protein